MYFSLFRSGKNVNTGLPHCKSQKTVKKMIMSDSETMKLKLKEQILKEDRPIVLVLGEYFVQPS